MRIAGLVLQKVITSLFGFFSVVALSAFLTSDEFGIFSIVLGVLNTAVLFSSFGIATILINTPKIGKENHLNTLKNSITSNLVNIFLAATMSTIYLNYIDSFQFSYIPWYAEFGLILLTLLASVIALSHEFILVKMGWPIIGGLSTNFARNTLRLALIIFFFQLFENNINEGLAIAIIIYLSSIVVSAWISFVAVKLFAEKESLHSHRPAEEHIASGSWARFVAQFSEMVNLLILQGAVLIIAERTSLLEIGKVGLLIQIATAFLMLNISPTIVWLPKLMSALEGNSIAELKLLLRKIRARNLLLTFVFSISLIAMMQIPMLTSLLSNFHRTTLEEALLLIPAFGVIALCGPVFNVLYNWKDYYFLISIQSLGLIGFLVLSLYLSTSLGSLAFIVAFSLASAGLKLLMTIRMNFLMLWRVKDGN